jgi:glucose dehydrogenase
MRPFIALAVAGLVAGSAIYAQQQAAAPGIGNFVPVTSQMLLNPPAEDWLMFSRTYDAQRHSPLNQITRQNVGQLREVFRKELGNGAHESIPLVHGGIMYLLLPGASLQAIHAATGQVIWEHKRPSGRSLAKTIAIYDDMVYQAAPDGFIVALDARTGAVRWETKTSGRLTSASWPSTARSSRDAHAIPTMWIATSLLTTRGPGRSCGSSTPRRGPTSLEETRGEARPTRRVRRRPGVWPVRTTRPPVA